MFLLLVKTTMYITHIFLPLVSIFVHAVLVALYAVSIHGQSGSDMSDPQHPQPGAPWYITQSCSVANTGAVRGFCQQAKGAFAVAVMMWYVFCTCPSLPNPSSIPKNKHNSTSNPNSSYPAHSSPCTSSWPSTPSSLPAPNATPAPHPSSPPPSNPTPETPKTCPPSRS